jgi:UDP:flavonoid glycosyltransferase YjiC (YdhE family)
MPVAYPRPGTGERPATGSGQGGGVRILVAALDSPGHAFPLVPLAVALRDAGHAITVAPGPDVAAGIGSSGLDVLPVGGSLRDGFGVARERLGVDGWPRDQQTVRALAGEVFGDVLPRRVLDDLAPWVAAHRPDLVIAEIGDPGAALAARTHGVPCVLHGFGRRPGPEAPMYHRALDRVAAIAAERGLDLAVGAALGHAYLDVCPPALQEPARGDELPELPLRPTAWNPPVAESSAPGRPWIYLTLGTAMGAPGVLRAAATALAGLGVDVLVAAGSVDLGELEGLATEQVRVEPFVAQAALFASDHPPQLVVHHGGSGTTLGAAAAAIPQLFLPQGADQFANAAAVTGVGAGATLASADAVADAALDLLGEGPARAAARALASEIAAMPSPADVAAGVEEWGQPEM